MKEVKRREIIASFLRFFGSNLYTKLMGNALSILNYHYFVEQNPSEYLEISRETLKYQLDWFQNNFKILALNEALEKLDNRIPLPKNAVAFTIDDGDKLTLKIASEEFSGRNIPVSAKDMSGAAKAMGYGGNEK